MLAQTIEQCYVILDMLSSADFQIADVAMVLAVYSASPQANQEAYNPRAVFAASLTSSLCSKGVLTCRSSSTDDSVQVECVTLLPHGFTPKTQHRLCCNACRLTWQLAWAEVCEY